VYTVIIPFQSRLSYLLNFRISSNKELLCEQLEHKYTIQKLAGASFFVIGSGLVYLLHKSTNNTFLTLSGIGTLAVCSLLTAGIINHIGQETRTNKALLTSLDTTLSISDLCTKTDPTGPEQKVKSLITKMLYTDAIKLTSADTANFQLPTDQDEKKQILKNAAFSLRHKFLNRKYTIQPSQSNDMKKILRGYFNDSSWEISYINNEL
jgi:hypothetical protein